MVFGLWFPGASGRSDRPHCHHDQMLVHKPVWWWYWKELLSGGLIISLLETGWHPKTAPTTSLCTRNPTPYSCLPSSPLKYTLCPSSDISPKYFQCISQSSTMFQWYLLIAWVSCSIFPAGLRVLTFHVPTAMFSLPLIFLIFGTPVTYLSPTSRCLTVVRIGVPVYSSKEQWLSDHIIIVKFTRDYARGRREQRNCFRPADVTFITSESDKNVALIFCKVWYLSFSIYTRVISSSLTPGEVQHAICLVYIKKIDTW